MVKSTGFPFGYGNLSYKIKPFDLLIIVYVLRSQANLKLYLRLCAGNAIGYFCTSILLYGFITILGELTKPKPNRNKNKV